MKMIMRTETFIQLCKNIFKPEEERINTTTIKKLQDKQLKKILDLYGPFFYCSILKIHNILEKPIQYKLKENYIADRHKLVLYGKIILEKINLFFLTKLGELIISFGPLSVIIRVIHK